MYIWSSYLQLVEKHGVVDGLEVRPGVLWEGPLDGLLQLVRLEEGVYDVDSGGDR